MKITQEELERRLGKSSILISRLGEARTNDNKGRGNDENNRNNAGRKESVPNAPPSLRIVAGVLAKAEGNSAQVARNLEITPGQVRYAVNQELTKLTEKKVQDVALTRLMDTLGLLTPELISGEKPKDVAAIGANLSRIHRNLREDSSTGAASPVQINIYSPKQKNMNDYEVIEIQTGT